MDAKEEIEKGSTPEEIIQGFTEETITERTNEAYIIKSEDGYYSSKNDSWSRDLTNASLMDKRTADAWEEHWSERKSQVEMVKITA